MGIRALSFLAIGSATAPVYAQTPRVDGPFAGLFGGDKQDSTQSLDARGSLSGLYQRANAPAGESAFLDPVFQQSGTFAVAAGSLAYTYDRHGQNSTLTAYGTGSVADYSVDPGSLAAGFRGGMGLTTNLTRKVTFGSSATVAYSPFFNFGALGFGAAPGTPPPIGDQSIPGSGLVGTGISSRNIGVDGTVSVTDALSRKSNIAVSGGANATYMLDNPDSDVSWYSAAVTFRHLLSRTLEFHLGYNHSVSASHAPNVQSYQSDGIDVGLGYGDSLAITRRTTLGFGTSTGLYHSAASSTTFRVNGNVSITHTMGRTWSAFAGYVRDANFVPGFQDLVLSDSVTASLGGLIAPKVRWTSSVWWSRGEIGLDSSTHYTNEWATSTMSFALTRALALYGQYSFNQYQTPANSSTIVRLTDFSRHTVSAGVSALLPIFNTRTRPGGMSPENGS
jgi:hypothetical protein